MAMLQQKRGTTAKRLAYTPAAGELIYDTELNKIFIGNGTTPGGVSILADVNIPVFSASGPGLVPARVGAVATKYLREDGTWVTPANTTYSAMTKAEVDAGTGTTARIISPSLLKSAVLKHAPVPGADNALFLGSVMWFNGQRAAVPDGYVTADGQVLKRSDYPSLWSAINGGRFVLVNDATWTLDPLVRASYSSGNGTSTFRLPDLNGAQENSLKGSFLRGDGLGNVDLAGKMQGDAIRNITGTVGQGNYANVSDGPFYIEGSASSSPNVAGSTRIVKMDASRVVPTANENRPVSSVGVWIIRVSGATSPLPAAGSPATLLANTFNGSQKIVGNLEVTGNLDISGTLAFAKGFENSLKETGYQKLPSGLIIQWGVFTPNASGGLPQYINFPIEFPNNLLFAIPSTNGAATSGLEMAWVDTSLSTTSKLGVYSNYNNSVCWYFAIGY